MRHATAAVLLVASLLVAACDGQSTSPRSQEPPSAGDFLPSARLSVTNGAGVPGPFALGQLDQLAIRVDGAYLSPGDHALRVDVLGPQGVLYAQLPATLTAGDDRTGTASSVIQVRGMPIDGYKQVGTWRLVAVVDGRRLANASVDLTE